MAEADAAWDGLAVDADVLISSEGLVGGVSSGAAQKAYPERYSSGVYALQQRSAQAAFDRGAVEALRQALDMYKSNQGGFLYRLEALIEEWEVGQ